MEMTPKMHHAACRKRNLLLAMVAFPAAIAAQNSVGYTYDASGKIGVILPFCSHFQNIHEV